MEIIAKATTSRKSIYRCECGRAFEAFTDNVKRGNTKSCGCLRRAIAVERFTKHGHKTGAARSQAYVSWMNMKARCNREAGPDYQNYRGRGIGYDPRWEDFTVFLADMGEPGKGLTLDRIDNALGYSKANCRWASRAVQNGNKRSVVRYELDGRSLTMAEWARETGIGASTLRKRLERGVPLAVAISARGYLRRGVTDNDTTGLIRIA